MPRYAAFISYSQSDEKQAADVHDFLEKNGPPCWMFSKDEDVGDDWPSANSEAMANSSTVVVLISAATGRSPYVLEEIVNGLALRNVLPVRIEKVELTGPLAVLRTHHCLDAWNMPEDRWRRRLLDSIKHRRRRQGLSLLLKVLIWAVVEWAAVLAFASWANHVSVGPSIEGWSTAILCSLLFAATGALTYLWLHRRKRRFIERLRKAFVTRMDEPRTGLGRSQTVS